MRRQVLFLLAAGMAAFALLVWLVTAADAACTKAHGHWEQTGTALTPHYLYDSKGNISTTYFTSDPVYGCVVPDE